MRRGSTPTLQDIGQEVGVSAMTVSVVLNGSRSATRVSEATRTRIQEAASRLGYRPNAVARGLSRRRMDTLGVAAIIDGQINLYFLEVLNGILAESAKQGQNTTIFSVSDWKNEESKLLPFCDGRVDGLILIAPTLTAEFAEALARHIPFVTLHGADTLPSISNLEVDNEGGAYLLVRHMIEQGHRRIGHFTGGLSSLGARLRHDGYRRALTEAGLPWNEDWVLPGDFTITSGRACMTALLDQRGSRPTAIFCANDAMAYGALEVMAAHGLHAPGDFSIGGFDDLVLAQMTLPHLTTMRQPFRAMGGRAVELLLAQISGEAKERVSLPPSTVPPIFPVELIIRGSIGPPA